MSLGLKYDKTWLAYLAWNKEMKSKGIEEVFFKEAYNLLDASVKLSLQPFILCKIVEAVAHAYAKGQLVERYIKIQMEEK